MNRRITGFHQDDEGQWVAELECGHGQHVRHEPPWQVRPWVMEPAARQARLGRWLDCRWCDRGEAGRDQAPDASRPPTDPFTDARLQGLCEEGAAEVARRKAPRPPA